MTAIRRRISTPFAGVSGSPQTVADPELGARSVASVRTVVVLPAPLGPRNPKISPRSISNDTSSKATRSPNRLPSPMADRAGAGRPAPAGGAADCSITRPS